MTAATRTGALALLLLLAAACTAGSAARFPVPVAGARTGGVLRIAITTPGSVDPGDDYEPSGDLVLRTLCDPLIAQDPQTGRLRPALAESWAVLDGGTRVVLRLRQGLRFSDGSPVSAPDVAFALSRVASADYASSAADRLALVLGYPQVHGDVPTDSDLDRRRLAGVRSVDQQSLEISLSRADGEWLRVLTTPLTVPVPRHRAAKDPDGFAARPVCSGPYRLDAPYRPGDTVLSASRVPGRRGVDTVLTGGGTGYPDRVEFHLYGSRDAAAAAAQRGEVDVGPARPTDVGRVESVPGPTVDYVGFPTTKAPFDQAAVRQALAAALDRSRLVARVFPTTRVPATGFLPPTTVPVFRPAACPPPAGATAADLRGLRVPFYFDDVGRNRALVTEVAAQWHAALGLQAVPTALSVADFLARGQSLSGFDGPFRFSWATPFPDPLGDLLPLFTTDRIGRDNMSRYSDPAVDETLATHVAEADDPADRQVELRHAEDLLCRSVPMVPATFSLSRWQFGSRVASASGQLLDRTTGYPLVRELYLRSP